MTKPPSRVTFDYDVPLRSAMREAVYLLNQSKKLPRYLEDALLKFNEERSKKIEREILIPKVEARLHARGLKRTKKAANNNSSFEATAEIFGVSMSTVEKAAKENPADPEDVANEPPNFLPRRRK